MIEIEGKKYYEIPDVVKTLEITTNSIRRWIREGKLKASKVGRKYIIPVEEVQRVLSEGTKEPVKVKETYYFIDAMDTAQELTDDAVIELANKHGKELLKHIYIETFTESEGIKYIPISETIHMI